MNRPLYIPPVVALVQIALLAFLLLAICGGAALLACMAHGAMQAVNVDAKGVVSKEGGRAAPLVSVGSIRTSQSAQSRKPWRPARSVRIR